MISNIAIISQNIVVAVAQGKGKGIQSVYHTLVAFMHCRLLHIVVKRRRKVILDKPLTIKCPVTFYQVVSSCKYVFHLAVQFQQ